MPNDPSQSQENFNRIFKVLTDYDPNFPAYELAVYILDNYHPMPPVSDESSRIGSISNHTKEIASEIFHLRQYMESGFNVNVSFELPSEVRDIVVSLGSLVSLQEQRLQRAEESLNLISKALKEMTELDETPAETIYRSDIIDCDESEVTNCVTV